MSAKNVSLQLAPSFTPALHLQSANCLARFLGTTIKDANLVLPSQGEGNAGCSLPKASSKFHHLPSGRSLSGT